MSDVHHTTVTSNVSGSRDEPKTPTSGTWIADASRSNPSTTAQPYKLHKSRFLGLSTLKSLNLMAAFGIAWFNPITTKLVTQFGFTPRQINMLPNAPASMYFPTCLCIPWLVSKYGLRRCCDIGAVIMVTAAWLRYASTARGLPNAAAYAILMISQLLSVVSISIFQVLGPKYSESWFNLKGRTTATTLIAISYIMGQGSAPLLAPFFKDTRLYILILAILPTIVAASVFKLHSEPPTPPTYAASQKSRSLKSLLLNLIGKQPSNVDVHPPMTRRERLDFMIVMHIFSTFVATLSTYMELSGKYFVPYGYSSNMIKYMAFPMLGCGIIAAFSSSSLMDRVYKRHLAIAMKIYVSALAASWLSLAWAIQADNTVVLMILLSVVGICSLALLPIALELAVELTRAPVASTALLCGMMHVVTMFFNHVEMFLQAGPNASPPKNMRKGLVFQAVYVCVSALVVIPLKGEQKRRNLDEREGKVGICVQTSIMGDDAKKNDGIETTVELVV